MDEGVKRKWEQGEVFGNPPQVISTGVFVLVDSMLRFIKDQQGDDYTAPLDCEDLLARMQSKCNEIRNPGQLLYNSYRRPTSRASQPLPPTASTSAVSQPAGSSSRTPQKRRNGDEDNGSSPKRRREMSSDLFSSFDDEPQERREMSSVLFGSSSSVEPDSPPIPGPVHHPRRQRPVRKRMLFGNDESNCVVNRTRAAPTPTELYQEPEQANWGRNSTEAIAVDAFLPTACPRRSRMSTCTNCYCQLTHVMNNTTALCVLCGRYKSRNVSIICIFY